MTGITDLGIACLEVVVGPKHVRELFMSKTRSRIMLVNTSLGSGRGKHGDMLSTGNQGRAHHHCQMLEKLQFQTEKNCPTDKKAETIFVE